MRKFISAGDIASLGASNTILGTGYTIFATSAGTGNEMNEGGGGGGGGEGGGGGGALFASQPVGLILADGMEIARLAARAVVVTVQAKGGEGRGGGEGGGGMERESKEILRKKMEKETKAKEMAGKAITRSSSCPFSSFAPHQSKEWSERGEATDSESTRSTSSSLVSPLSPSATAAAVVLATAAAVSSSLPSAAAAVAVVAAGGLAAAVTTVQQDEEDSGESSDDGEQQLSNEGERETDKNDTWETQGDDIVQVEGAISTSGQKHFYMETQVCFCDPKEKQRKLNGPKNVCSGLLGMVVVVVEENFI